MSPNRRRSENGWALAVFRAPSETLIVRFRTPAGRKLFYATNRLIETTRGRRRWQAAERARGGGIERPDTHEKSRYA